MKKDRKEGDAAGVDSTPTVFIDGKKFHGALDLEGIKPVIEAELKGKWPPFSFPRSAPSKRQTV